MSADPRRRIPSVDSLLREPGVEALLRSAPRTVVVAAVREALAEARQAPGGLPANWIAEVEQRVARRTTPSLLPVINATGVVLHTNLGRAPLAGAALAAMHAAGAGYSNLEFDLASGRRGNRSGHCRALLAELTGSEDALVVNNAAGALVLILNQLATGREVIISRGELIEIGGSFRIPEILEKSGAVLREVGTTNRTHLDDYARAIGPATGAILTVHQSNFEQRGFVTAPAPKELAELAQQRGVPYLHDIGSGLMADLSAFGLTTEPGVREAVRSGAHAVLFSGDKLLGGPQAGCLVGRTEVVAACRRNAFARAFRADKLTLAALEATLRLYHDPEEARREIPVLAMLTAEPAELAERAHRLAGLLPAAARAQVIAGESAVGGGAFPGAVLPTFLIALEPGSDGADLLAFRLRVGAPPVVARVGEGRVLLDPRTVPEESLPRLADAVAAALAA